MRPNGAVINSTDQFQAQNGSVNPAAFQAPNMPPPNPELGDNMRNRNWAAREQQSYYEMQHAPQPYQYTRDQAHPLYGGGSGTPLTQWLPQGPPTGFAARNAPVRYSVPGTNPGLVRPTGAYNRVVGRGSPVNYAVTTWPNQGYPSGSNTYIPSYEATGVIIKFTRDQANFRINKYVKTLKVPNDMGYYLTLSPDDPYRVVTTNTFLWEDQADAPGGRDQKQGFAFMPYRTARYCFPFNLGRKSVDQSVWPILAEHAQMQAAKAMTVRTLLNTSLATNTANWTGTWGTNTGAVSGVWSTSPQGTDYIQKDLNTALIAVEQSSGGIISDEEALQLTLNPQLGRGIAVSPEYKQYIAGSPDALAAITDQRNPNRKYGLAPFLYGLRLVVENAIVVTTPKSANTASPASQARSYVWNKQYVVISSKPEGISAPDEQTLDFSTFCMRFYEQMTVESKSDPDNRREVGRVVEDYMASLQAPMTGYLLTGAS